MSSQEKLINIDSGDAFLFLAQLSDVVSARASDFSLHSLCSTIRRNFSATVNRFQKTFFCATRAHSAVEE